MMGLWCKEDPWGTKFYWVGQKVRTIFLDPGGDRSSDLSSHIKIPHRVTSLALWENIYKRPNNIAKPKRKSYK